MHLTMFTRKGALDNKPTALVRSQLLLNASVRRVEKAEEAEEALRENTLALENARAEIEGLRSEFAVSGNILVVNCILTRCLGRLWKAIKPETLPKR